MQLMKTQIQLRYIRTPFSPDSSVGGQSKNSDFIFELTNDYIYVICYGDDPIDPYGQEELSHKLNYYLKEFEPIRDDYNPEYFGVDYEPNLEKVYVSNEYTYYGGNYAVFKVYDAKTLNFLLTTNNETIMHIFSSDYDLTFLKSYLLEYYEFFGGIEKQGKNGEYVYLCKKYKEYLMSKRFVFYSTYSDDEDDNFLFISGNTRIIEKVLKYFSISLNAQVN
jgi:hypothetical protein